MRDRLSVIGVMVAPDNNVGSRKGRPDGTKDTVGSSRGVAEWLSVIRPYRTQS